VISYLIVIRFQVEGDTFTDGHREMATTQCGQNQRQFFLTFTTDNRGEELSFQLIGPTGGVIGKGPAAGQTFQDQKQYTFRYCVWIGHQHRLKLKDTGGNGIVSNHSYVTCYLDLLFGASNDLSFQCCQFGKGTYQYGIDGTKMYGSNMQKTFNAEAVHTFEVPARASSGSGSSVGRLDDYGEARDDAWLQAHNVRRKKYHEQWGRSYVPLDWSPMLAKQARQWAEHLATKCEGVTLETLNKVKVTKADHEPLIVYGENMAANFGNGDYGKLKTPDQVMTRFVEWELDVPFPENYHMTQVRCADVRLVVFSSTATHIKSIFTQVLWRATKYVGCADSVRAIEGVVGGYCHFQVCRYAVTGNCAMGLHQYADGSVNWKKSVLDDELRQCGTTCTPEGWC
jgi:hypothetical protein